jgi:formylglycine-generating enzyme required for sulfatase activity
MNEEEKREAELERQRREEIVIIDGLMYQNQPFTKGYSWEEAKEYAKNLRLGGYSDWRLPTIDELKKLLVQDSITNSQGKEYFIRKEFVENLKGNAWFWSITERNNSSSLVRLIFFNRGSDHWFFKSRVDYALCVREV